MGPHCLLRAHPETLWGPPLSNPVWVCVLWICLVLIGVSAREEALKHTDPPVSCPCAQPVMSRASSSRALWLSLWALSAPTTALPRLWCPLRELHAHLLRGPTFSESNPVPPTRTLGVCRKTRAQSLGAALWLSQSPIFVVSPGLVQRILGRKHMLVLRWSLRERGK